MQELAAHGYQYRLAGRHVTQYLEAKRLGRHALRGDHVFRPSLGIQLADHQRADAVGIPECQKAESGDHGHHGVGALATPMHARHRGEHILGGQTMALHRFMQFVGQHVKQDLGIRAGINMAQIVQEQLLLQRIGVGQIAVVGKNDAERRIHVERLGLGRARGGTRRGIAHMGDTDVARQVAHVAGTEYVAHHTKMLVHVEHAPIHGDDAGGVLPAMLQQLKPVVEGLVDGLAGKYADDATHDAEPRSVANQGCRIASQPGFEFRGSLFPRRANPGVAPGP
jgi:hypothetical protein